MTTIDLQKPALTDEEVDKVADGLIGVIVAHACHEMGGSAVYVSGSLGDTVSEATKLRVLAAFNRRAQHMREIANSLKIST